jgi:tRNA A58 N-methylase Trm61
MRAWIYDHAFLPLTIKWYRSVLEQLPAGCRLLDIGIGTGGALVANKDLLEGKDLHVYGVDIDADYVKQADAAIRAAGLADRVTVALESIYDHKGGPYDAAYFGASFMLMPDPQGALRHVMSLLRPGGRVYFTQTFQEKRSKIVETMKPLLVKLTTIDFGKVTYEADFLKVVDEAGMEVLSNDTLDKGRMQSFRRVIGRPRSVAIEA